MLNSGGFFGTGNSECKTVNFFTDTDVSTVLGKNLVKNYVGKIGFELGLMGFSDTANDIAEYYEECRTNTSVIDFMQNEVVKMILEEMKNNKKTQSYLNDRIFNDIFNDYTKRLNDYFMQSEKMYNENKMQEMKYLKAKLELQKKIQEIAKKYNLTEEQAEKKLKDEQRQKKLKENFNEFMRLPDFFGTGLTADGVIADKDITLSLPFSSSTKFVETDEEKPKKSNKQKVVKFEDDEEYEEINEDDNFFDF